MFGRLHRSRPLPGLAVGSVVALLHAVIGDGRDPSRAENVGTSCEGIPKEFQHLLRQHNYPEWDYDWDGLQTQKKCRTTRHILLIRHGQYEERHDKDAQRVLTPLGRIQAEYTGERLSQMLHCTAQGDENDRHPPTKCRLVGLHVSGMKRAQETADIIADHLLANHQHWMRTPPDPLLNEGFPAPIIPLRRELGTLQSQATSIEESSDRIEQAFQKYVHRSFNQDENIDHEFEIIVCHANIIRYFILRALQLPPEAWLRFSLFNCSISYLMIQPDGTVSVRMIGDTGHIPYQATTFSGSYGYNWKTPCST
jgi:serine/threonine-protein phosphatase PGAM5